MWSQEFDACYALESTVKTGLFCHSQRRPCASCIPSLPPSVCTWAAFDLAVTQLSFQVPESAVSAIVLYVLFFPRPPTRHNDFDTHLLTQSLYGLDPFLLGKYLWAERLSLALGCVDRLGNRLFSRRLDFRHSISHEGNLELLCPSLVFTILVWAKFIAF